MERKKTLLICSVLFVVLVLAGLFLARLKPLWNDELYSQIASVDNISYASIVGGQVREGNNTPLFYLIQKAICDLAHYRLPYVWKGGDIYDPYAQTLLRLAPIVSIALALVVVFYFFARYQGLVMGIYALSLFATSFAIWAYIAEARPYALWLLLTTLQVIVFYQSLKDDSAPRWRNLAIVHCLLSLTSAFGMLQAVLVAMLYFFFKRSHQISRYLWILCIPLALGLFYQYQAPKYQFHVGDMISLLSMHLSLDRLIFLSVYLSCVFVIPNWRRQWVSMAENCVVLFFFGLLLACVSLIMYYQSLHVPPDVGFGLAPRYFINLAPVGSLAIILSAHRALVHFKDDRWARFNVHLLLVGLILIEAIRTGTFMIGFYQW